MKSRIRPSIFLALAAGLLATMGMLDNSRFGLDIRFDDHRTSISLVAPLIRVAFDFEHYRPKSGTRFGDLS